MRFHKDAKTELIKQVPLFAECSKNELKEVAMLADEIDLAAGEEVTHQGSRGRELVVVVEGSADVRMDGRTIGRLGPGDFAGEIALITGEPRTATVVATEPLRVLVISERAFAQLRRDSPSINEKVERVAQERLANDRKQASGD